MAGDLDLSRTSYGEFFFVGALTMVVLFTSVFATITVIEDRTQGFLQGVLVSPVPRTAIALGKISGGSTRPRSPSSRAGSSRSSAATRSCTSA